MTPSHKERILDLVWKAMSAAARGEAIPPDAEMLAYEIDQFLDLLIAATPQDNG
jgi:hypothetical protein